VPRRLEALEHAPHRGWVAGQSVRDHHPGLIPTPVEHTSQEPLGRLLVLAWLDQDVEHLPVLVDGPPQLVPVPVDLQLHLVQVPFVPQSRPASLHPVGEALPELLAPAADGLVAQRDAALGEQFLDVAVAEQEAVIQSYGMADDLTWEAKARVEY
jgi:hypothetical protein